jgi:Xaa-Pro aminopeptidase
MIKTRLEKLRILMRQHNITNYLIPASDYHLSEYIGDHFKQRRFLSNFSGSAGTLLVGLNDARLWTDGRYFIQAEEELKDTSIILMKSGVEGVPSIEQYLASTLADSDHLAFDGRYLSAAFVKSLKQLLPSKVKITYTEDLVDLIWENRPKMENNPVFDLDIKYCGATYLEKIELVRGKMKECGASSHLLTSLDDIAYLFNFRGNDILFNPVAFAYAYITLSQTYLFISHERINDDLLTRLNHNQVKILPYNDIYEFVKRIDEPSILIDTNKVNYSLYQSIPTKVKIIDTPNPTMLFKCVKNEVEIQSLRNSHLKDGVAVTKFMYWLKTNVGKAEITEMSASDMMQKFREEQPGFIEPSFNTICAYNEHAAMMHYSASPKSNSIIKPEGLLLIDSGGQYYEGTTDITRTFVVGPISDEVKKHFTLVLKGMIDLSLARFLYGCRGMNLDILARQPLWKEMLDYRSGTGHGVGFLLNVHEAPNGFRWKIVPERNDSAVLEAGMVTTNEPGLYLEGKYGIRHENELLCKNREKNEYGQFMDFETLTLAPIDLDGIDTSYLNKEEIDFLNDYHQRVYTKISPYLNEEEKAFLKQYTRKI